jgi:hypothetical protein
MSHHDLFDISYNSKSHYSGVCPIIEETLQPIGVKAMMVRHTTQVSATNIIGALWID